MHIHPLTFASSSRSTLGLGCLRTSSMRVTSTLRVLTFSPIDGIRAVERFYTGKTFFKLGLSHKLREVVDDSFAAFYGLNSGMSSASDYAILAHVDRRVDAHRDHVLDAVLCCQVDP